jgi:hypothetical protein
MSKPTTNENDKPDKPDTTPRFSASRWLVLRSIRLSTVKRRKANGWFKARHIINEGAGRAQDGRAAPYRDLYRVEDAGGGGHQERQQDGRSGGRSRHPARTSSVTTATGCRTWLRGGLRSGSCAKEFLTLTYRGIVLLLPLIRQFFAAALATISPYRKGAMEMAGMTQIDHPATQKYSVSSFWAVLLNVIGAGKSAVGGAGIAIAALGLINSLVLITAATDLASTPHWQRSFQTEEHLLQIFALLGAIAGGVFGWIVRKR